MLLLFGCPVGEYWLTTLIKGLKYQAKGLTGFVCLFVFLIQNGLLVMFLNM